MKTFFLSLISFACVAQTPLINTINNRPIRTFYPSTDKCIAAGVLGSTGYISFGDFSIDKSTGNEVAAWRISSDHNSTSGVATVNVYTKAYGSSTIYGPVQIYGATTGINNTNVSSVITSTGRVIVFWLEITVASATGDLYYKYSDDLKNNITTPASATWSSRIRLTTDYGTGQSNIYIDGPGQCIQLNNGDLLKPVWMNTLLCGVYASTDNGGSWTFRSFISTGSPANDETSIVQMPNGTIIAAIRCNSLHVIRTATSTDNGATWSALTNTIIQSYGKPALCQYNGVLFGICRDYTSSTFQSQRTMYFTSTDLVNYTVGYLDGREETYLYGTPNYNPQEGKIIVWYAVETTNPSTVNGPTRLVRKEVSITPVSRPTEYSTLYQRVIDYCNANNETIPSDATKLSQSNLISTLYANGKWAYADEVYILAMNNSAVSEMSKRNFIKPWQKSTITGTYTVNGWDFNGSSDKFISNTVLSNLVNFKQNDAEVCVYQYEEGTDAGATLGTGDGAYSTRTNYVKLNTRYTDNNCYYGINGGTLQSFANSTGLALWELKRVSSTSIQLWKDGSMLTSASVTSTGRAAQLLTIGCERFSNGDFLFSSKGVGLVYIGGTKASWQSEWAAYKTAIGL